MICVYALFSSMAMTMWSGGTTPGMAADDGATRLPNATAATNEQTPAPFIEPSCVLVDMAAGTLQQPPRRHKRRTAVFPSIEGRSADAARPCDDGGYEGEPDGSVEKPRE